MTLNRQIFHIFATFVAIIQLNFHLGYASCKNELMDDIQSEENYLVLSVRSPLKAGLHMMLSDVKPEKLSLIAGSQFFSEEDKFVLSPSFNTIVRVEDYRTSGNLELVAYNIYKRKPFQKIVAYHEYDLLRAARLREFFRLEGQNHYSALAFRDKILMKEILTKANIKVPLFNRINSPIDIIDFAHKNRFPVVVKPVLGTGSDRTSVLRNSKEVENFIRKEKSFNDNCQTDLEIESFIEAVTYHVEGFIYKKKIVASWPSICINHSIDLNKGMYLGHHHLSSENPMVKRLNDYAQLVLESLPVPDNTAFLLEVFHKKKTDELIFCEIASRVGGGVREMWLEDFGIDIEAEFIRTQIGLKPQKELLNFFENVRPTISTFPKAISGWIIFPKLTGTLVNIPKDIPFPWVKNYLMKVQSGTVTSKTTNVSDTVASVFLTSCSTEEFNERVNLLVQMFNTEIKWEQPLVLKKSSCCFDVCNICHNCDACQEADEIIPNCNKECCRSLLE